MISPLILQSGLSLHSFLNSACMWCNSNFSTPSHMSSKTFTAATKTACAFFQVVGTSVGTAKLEVYESILRAAWPLKQELRGAIYIHRMLVGRVCVSGKLVSDVSWCQAPSCHPRPRLASSSPAAVSEFCGRGPGSTARQALTNQGQFASDYASMTALGLMSRGLTRHAPRRASTYYNRDAS